jgi:hypothetical protein
VGCERIKCGERQSGSQKDALCVGGYARRATDVMSIERCGASARLATHVFTFSCGGSDGGRGELEREMGCELGSEAEASMTGESETRSFTQVILTHVIACTGTCQWSYRASDRSPYGYESRQHLSAIPQCLPTSTCLLLLGRLR